MLAVTIAALLIVFSGEEIILLAVDWLLCVEALFGMPLIETGEEAVLLPADLEDAVVTV